MRLRSVRLGIATGALIVFDHTDDGFIIGLGDFLYPLVLAVGQIFQACGSAVGSASRAALTSAFNGAGKSVWIAQGLPGRRGDFQITRVWPLGIMPFPSMRATLLRSSFVH